MAVKTICCQRSADSRLRPMLSAKVPGKGVARHPGSDPPDSEYSLSSRGTDGGWRREIRACLLWSIAAGDDVLFHVKRSMQTHFQTVTIVPLQKKWKGPFAASRPAHPASRNRVLQSDSTSISSCRTLVRDCDEVTELKWRLSHDHVCVLIPT